MSRGKKTQKICNKHGGHLNCPICLQSRLSALEEVARDMGEAIKKYFEQERVEALGYFGIQRKLRTEQSEPLLQEALTAYTNLIEGEKS